MITLLDFNENMDLSLLYFITYQLFEISFFDYLINKLTLLILTEKSLMPYILLRKYL